jgi:hypothetical protein
MKTHLHKLLLVGAGFIGAFGAYASLAQNAFILTPSLWRGPIPGDYQFSPVDGSGLCAGFTSSTTTFRKDYLSLQPCPLILPPGDLSGTPQAAFRTLAVVPHPDGGHRLTVRGACATVARGVIFGAPAIDVLPCDQPLSQSAALAGANDQRFILTAKGAGIVEIRTATGKCVSPHGGPQAIDTQLIETDCNGSRGQLFNMTLAGSVSDQRDVEALTLFGWTRLGELTRSNLNPIARIIPNRMMASPTYQTSQTANDDGRSCAIQCLSDPRCKGYNWSKPSAPNPLLCELKASVVPSTVNASIVTGQVRQ